MILTFLEALARASSELAQPDMFVRISCPFDYRRRPIDNFVGGNFMETDDVVLLHVVYYHLPHLLLEAGAPVS